MGDKIRIVFTIAILILVPLGFIALGVHGIITGHFDHRRIHITGLPARLICSAAILGGLAIFRIYWFTFRGKGIIMDDGVLKAILVLAAIALGAGLIAGFFSVAF